MRQRLIKKKIEVQRLKKEEEQQKRVDLIKKQIGKFLLAHIKEARLKSVQEKQKKVVVKTVQQAIQIPVAKQKAIVAKIGASSSKEILRLLLEQWKAQLKEQQSDSFQNIWEKNTADNKVPDSPRSSVSKV